MQAHREAQNKDVSVEAFPVAVVLAGSLAGIPVVALFDIPAEVLAALVVPAVSDHAVVRPKTEVPHLEHLR